MSLTYKKDSDSARRRSGSSSRLERLGNYTDGYFTIAVFIWRDNYYSPSHTHAHTVTLRTHTLAHTDTRY